LIRKALWLLPLALTILLIHSCESQPDVPLVVAEVVPTTTTTTVKAPVMIVSQTPATTTTTTLAPPPKPILPSISEPEYRNLFASVNDAYKEALFYELGPLLSEGFVSASAQFQDARANFETQVWRWPYNGEAAYPFAQELRSVGRSFEALLTKGLPLRSGAEKTTVQGMADATVADGIAQASPERASKAQAEYELGKSFHTKAQYRASIASFRKAKLLYASANAIVAAEAQKTKLEESGFAKYSPYDIIEADRLMTEDESLYALGDDESVARGTELLARARQYYVNAYAWGLECDASVAHDKALLAKRRADSLAAELNATDDYEKAATSLEKGDQDRSASDFSSAASKFRQAEASFEEAYRLAAQSQCEARAARELSYRGLGYLRTGFTVAGIEPDSAFMEAELFIGLADLALDDTSFAIAKADYLEALAQLEISQANLQVALEARQRAAQAETERRAAERAALEKAAAEAKEEADRLAAERAAFTAKAESERIEAERLAAERAAAEQAALDNAAAEQAARDKAAMEAAAAERAATEAAAQEAEHRAAEAATQAKAAAEAARLAADSEAARLAAEAEAASKERAAAEAAAREAERLAAEAAARDKAASDAEAAARAAQAAARAAADQIQQQEAARAAALSTLNQAQARYEWAASVNAEHNYPEAYAAGADQLRQARLAYEATDYQNALSQAQSALSSLEGIAEFAPFPAVYIVDLVPQHKNIDSFSFIAAQEYIYNDSFKWGILYEANKAQLRDPDNPDLLLSGQKIIVPSLRGEERSGVWDPEKTYGAFDKGYISGEEKQAVESALNAGLAAKAKTLANAKNLLDEGQKAYEKALARNAANNYPKALAEALTLLERAKTSFKIGNYTSVANQAKKAAEAFAAIPEFAPLPARYKVRYIPGETDTLWRISGYSFIYNDNSLWMRIYNANKELPHAVEDPHLIIPGQILAIPSLKGERREGLWDPKKTYPIYPTR